MRGLARKCEVMQFNDDIPEPITEQAMRLVFRWLCEDLKEGNDEVANVYLFSK